MRKTTIFATFLGIAATSALATYHIVRLLDEKKQKAEIKAICEEAAPAVEAEGIENGEAEADVKAVATAVEKTEAFPEDAVLGKKEEGDDEVAFDLCYYLPKSKVWHRDAGCAFISGKSDIVSTTVAKANEAGKMRGCSRCGM